MRSRLILAFVALCCATAPFAQDTSADAAPDRRSSLAFVEYSDYEKGDGIFAITLGTSVPLGFYDPNQASFRKPQSYPGFAFSLSYLGLLNENWAIGGDLGGSFIGTIADRSLFIAPLSFRAGYLINLSPFAIMPSAGLGVAICSLGEYKHVDPLFKLGSSFYWRQNADMSYGLNIFANVIPQFYKDRSQNMTGFFLEATLSLAYHL